MKYTTISISKELKKKILILKAEYEKNTLEDLLNEMYKAYKKQEENKNKQEVNNVCL